MKKVVLYSSNSKNRDKNSNCTVFPSWASQWDQMAKKHPELDITLVVQLNGRYFLDIRDGELIKEPDNIHVKILPKEAKIPEFVETVYALSPDIAIAMPGPVSGYDWNCIRDASIAEGLRRKGIETICYSNKTALDCFDKWRTQQMLQSNGFRTPNGLYLHHELFASQKGSEASTGNVYQEYILYQVENMEMPVVIKSTTGASSMGIHIAKDYDDAKEYLLSEKLDEDVLIQEFLVGEEYGMEIHGNKGNYVISPPYRIFNIDKGELNDPLGKNTLKYGPILDEKLKIGELRKQLLRLANIMEFTGIIEVDLVLVKDEWYILEINNRWSGLTTLVTSSQGRVPYDVYVEQYEAGNIDLNDINNLKFACQFKIPDANEKALAEIAEEDAVTSVIQYEVRMPGKEVFYLNDAVIGGFDSMETLIAGFKALQKKYPDRIRELLVEALEQKESK